MLEVNQIAKQVPRAAVPLVLGNLGNRVLLDLQRAVVHVGPGWGGLGGTWACLLRHGYSRGHHGALGRPRPDYGWSSVVQTIRLRLETPAAAYTGV